MACWYIVTDICTDHFFMGPLNSHKKQRHTRRCKLCFVVLCCPLLWYVLDQTDHQSEEERWYIACIRGVSTWVFQNLLVFFHTVISIVHSEWYEKEKKNAFLMSEVRGECSDCFELRLQLSQASLFMSPRILLGKICVCLHVHAEEGIFETFKVSHSNLRAEIWPSICFRQQEKLLQRSWLCWC